MKPIAKAIEDADDNGRVIFGSVGSRILGAANLARVAVRTLRRKLGDDAANPERIFNVRGAGCRMAGPGEE